MTTKNKTHQRTLTYAKRAIPSAIAVWAMLVGLFGLSGNASAAAYVGSAYEPFNYTAGDTLPNGSVVTGSGFNSTGDSSLPSAATWTPANTQTATVLGSSLSFGAVGYAASANGSVNVSGISGSGSRYIPFQQSVDSGSIWFSYLTSKTVDSARQLHVASGPSGTVFSFGQFGPSDGVNASGGNFVLQIGGVAYGATTAYDLNVTHLVIGRVDFDFGGVGVDRVSVYLDPTDVTSESALASFLYTQGQGDAGIFSGFRLFAGGPGTVLPYSGATFDELRAGTSLASVAGVPEPGSVTLLLLGGGSFFCFRRRGQR